MNHLLAKIDFYTIGRFAAIVTKPLIIYWLVNFVDIEEGNAIAKTFVLIAVSLVLINTDVFRDYYFNLFNKKKFHISFSGFIVGTILISIVGFIIIFTIYKFYLSSSSIRAACIALFFLTEKLSDESLRFKIFAKDFKSWGKAQLTKALLILILLISIFYLDEPDQISILLSMSIVNLIVFGKYFPLNYVLKIINSKNFSKLIIRRGIKYNLRHKTFLLLAIFTTSVAHIDRMLALVIAQEKIAILILIINSFSIMVMLFDFYYLSFKRQDFLTGKITIVSALNSFEIWRILILGALIGFAACVFILKTTTGSDLVLVSDVLGIFAFQLIACISYISFNILYWKNKISFLIKTDIFFWFIFFLFQGIAYVNKIGNEILIAALLVFFRTLYLSFHASKT